MIIKVFNNSSSTPQSYSFKQTQVIIGRNPKSSQKILVDCQSVSRQHIKIIKKNDTIKIIDLNSSNGTYINDKQIQANQKIQINKNDQIKLAEFQGYLTAELRIKQKQKQKNNNKKKSSSSSLSSSEQQSRQRSRQRSKSNKSSIQIAQSTLKMLRTMTVDKKSKAQKIKFLKLMGYPQAQQCWDEIQQLINKKKTFFLSNANKKASMELQKQFASSRNAHEKKGLGK